MFFFDKIFEFAVLKSDKLPNLNHFFTTKGFILKENIQNINLIKKEFKLHKIFSPEQTHSSNVEYADINKNFYPNCDALILNLQNVGIFLNFADCTPIILYDKKENIGAIVHSGHRGTKEKIVQKTVLKMNSNPKNIIAVIGPCICYDCFETSEEIMISLSKTIKNIDNFCIKEQNGRFYANLSEIIKRQLNDIGVENIDISPYCTSCNNDKFYSYRRENKTTNRMSVFISL